MLPQRSEDDRYVVRYSNALDRGYLKFLFGSAVQNVDRDNKELTVELDYQTVRALWRTGYAVRPAPAQQPAG
jgi:hypothetical protein